MWLKVFGHMYKDYLKLYAQVDKITTEIVDSDQTAPEKNLAHWKE